MAQYTSSDQFGRYAERFVYFDNVKWSSTLNLGSLSLSFLQKLIYVLTFNPTGFILIVL